MIPKYVDAEVPYTNGVVFAHHLCTSASSLVAQMVKNLPAMQETQVPFMGWEDPVEKGTATHSSFLACRSPWTEEPGRLQSMGPQRVRHD